MQEVCKISDEVCEECINRDLHCCKRMPLFNNFEIVKLIEDGVLEKFGYAGKIVIWRYHDKHEVFTILYKEESFKDYKAEKKECIFFDKEEGCKLKEYMPLYCKVYRENNHILHCPFMDIGFELKKNELIRIRNALDYSKRDEYYSFVFKNFLKRFRKRNSLKKIVKDEIVLALFVHALNLSFNELEKENILKKVETKIFDIEQNGEVYIYRVLKVKALNENPFIKEYARKVNHILNNLYNNKTPLEIDILVQKTQSVINGIDDIVYKDEELEENFRGFLLANTILYLYKKEFKNKHKIFKGLAVNEAFLDEVESFIMNKLDKKGIDMIEEIEKMEEFVRKFIKRIIKSK